MKDFALLLLDIAERLKYHDEITVEVNDVKIKVAELQKDDIPYSTIKLVFESDESHGVIYKVGITDSAKDSIANFDKSDYFNQNLVTPLILEYEELKQVLVAYSNLDKLVQVLITEVLYEIIKDK